ncbi:MAG: glycosyl hydrolase family 18 protein, partial [Cellulosilyticaceae bacterium]
MKLVQKARKILASMMVVSMVLGGVVVTNPMEVSALEQNNTSNKRNVMYYGDWSVWGGQGNFYPQHMAADQLTHLNFAFLDFDAQGNLIFTDKGAAAENPLGQAGITWGDVNAGILPALVELRAQNPNLKIGVSIGGWSKSGDFTAMASNLTARTNFVENVMKFVEYTQMDFVDIDWEYPASVREADLVDNKNDEGTPNARPEDKDNYIILLQDLRDALDAQGVELGKTYELSVALPASQSKLEAGVDVQRMFEIIDFGNIMTYDMRGAFDPISGHQAGLYPNANDPMADSKFTIDEAVTYMLDNGAPAEKIVVGAAYYTRGWENVTGGTDANNPGLFGEAAIAGRDADQAPSRGAANEAPLASGDGGRRGGIWSYGSLNKLKAAYPGLREYWDDEAKAPYLYDATTGAFFTYDNVRSIEEKAKYVNENELGGMIAWMASMDAPTGSGKRDELTKATKKALFGNGKLTEHEIVYADLDISVAISPFMESWGNTGGYEISITNNERLEESGEVLQTTEKMAETITLPKLYIKHDGPALSKGDYTAGTVTQEGDYTVVDFGSIYDGKAIVPGQTYTFRLKSTGPVEDISALESIELVQRITKEGTEIKRQTIYGDIETVNQAPVITGATDKKITVGDAFDPMAGVTALDKEDGTITDRINVTGEVNVNEIGEYTLTYTVTDSEGLTTTILRKVVVEAKAPNQAPVLRGITDKTITVGDAFDKMAGVTATDKEDGTITDRIEVSGEVDTTVAGTYELVYTVADSEGLEASATRTITVQEYVAPEIPESDFGVGEGIVWPAQVNAPFVDMGAWVTKPGYANNGAPNLVKLAEDTDVNFFNLGFIQSVGGQIRD